MLEVTKRFFSFPFRGDQKPYLRQWRGCMNFWSLNYIVNVTSAHQGQLEYVLPTSSSLERAAPWLLMVLNRLSDFSTLRIPGVYCWSPSWQCVPPLLISSSLCLKKILESIWILTWDCFDIPQIKLYFQRIRATWIGMITIVVFLVQPYRLYTDLILRKKI